MLCFLCVDDLGELLLGECKLQTYLKENPIKQGASPKGPNPKLVEVRKHLTAALDRGNLKVRRNCGTVVYLCPVCFFLVCQTNRFCPSG